MSLATLFDSGREVAMRARFDRARQESPPFRSR
jgi:hypothetical protein